MKISPIAAPSAVPQSADIGMSASPDRLARAKAVMTGQPVPEAQTTDPQVDRAQQSIKRIKMTTQRSTNRYVPPAEPVVETPEAPATTEVAAQGDILETSEPAAQVTEDTELVSPQFAALAKAKRAAQAKEAAIAQRERELAQKEAEMKAAAEKLTRLKSDPLRVLQEEGVTYDQLTESLLSQNQANPGVDELRAELKALKEGIEKSQADRDAQAERQVLGQLRRDVENLIQQGDDFEMVREAGYAPQVVDLIHRVFKQSGEVLDTAQAAAMVEEELLNESLRFANLKKVQSRLATAAPSQQQQPAQQARLTQAKPMKTLTARDGASKPLSARERAIAAFYGKN